MKFSAIAAALAFFYDAACPSPNTSVCRRRLMDRSIDLSKGVFWPMITRLGVNNGAIHEDRQRCS